MVYQVPDLNLPGVFILYRKLDIPEVIKFRIILDATRSNMQFVFH